MFEISPHTPPEPLYRVQQEFAEGPITTATPHSNFLKGVKWSPDGLCFLTASDDNWFRIFDTPPEAFAACQPAVGDDAAAAGPAAAVAAVAAAGPLSAGSQQPEQAHPTASASSHDAPDSFPPALRIEEGELIYDYAWFPRMLASDPATCCFAATSRAHPVHLWDACTGELRCTYRAYDAADEVTAAYSLTFDPDGTRLVCGFNRSIRTFDVSRPGREYRTITTYQKRQEGQPGIISCLAFNLDRSGMLAAGAYSGVGALYDLDAGGALIALLEGHSGGITQVQFSACGNYLYTGARRDTRLLCWDVRFSSGVLYAMPRASAATNQRIQFDIEPCGRHLATGGEDGVVRVFDLRDGSEAAAFRAAGDTVNGCHFHPYLPLLATASGHRRLFLAESSDSSSSDDDDDGAAVGPGSSGGGSLLRSGGGPAEGAGAVPASTAAGAAAASQGEEGGGKDGGPDDEGLEENVLRVWRFLAETLPEPGSEAQQTATAAEQQQQQQQQEPDEGGEGGEVGGALLLGAVEEEELPQRGMLADS